MPKHDEAPPLKKRDAVRGEAWYPDFAARAHIKLRGMLPEAAHRPTSNAPDYASRPQRYHPGSDVNSPYHAIYTLGTSGWYTPEAMREIASTPIAVRDFADERGGQYLPARAYGNAKPTVEIARAMWAVPEWRASVLRHEFAHHFDISRNKTPLVNGQWTGRYSQDPKLAYALRQLYAPGVAFSPLEEYAYIAQWPKGWADKKRLYPFYTPAAFFYPESNKHQKPEGE